MDVDRSVKDNLGTQGNASAPKVVLIVDDNVDDQMLLQRIMRRHTLVNPVYTLSDGESAITYLEGLHPYSQRALFPFPAVMFLDFHLPRKSGMDVLKWIHSRAELPDFKIFIYTDVTLFPHLQECYKFGAHGFLLKEEQERQFEVMLRDFPDLWQFRYPDQRSAMNSVAA
jgi:CheY-like chemotaxis protein